MKKEDWQIFTLNKLQKDPDVATFNLTKSYTTGQNLQSADQVIHLDRDSWNNENMKQRTARAWRSGQKNHVDVSICELVTDSGDSINDIEGYSMDIEEQMFNDLIKGSSDVELEKMNINKTEIEQILRKKEILSYMLNPNIKDSLEIDK